MRFTLYGLLLALIKTCLLHLPYFFGVTSRLYLLNIPLNRTMPSASHYSSILPSR